MWEANRWVARHLTDAFIEGNNAFTPAQRELPYATPWLEAELEETSALMGEDFHPYGSKRIAGRWRCSAEPGFEAGLTLAVWSSVDDYFAEFLAA